MNYINMPDYVKIQNPVALIPNYDLGKYEATI